MSAQAWDDPAGRIRDLETEVHNLRTGVEALCDPGSDGPRPYAVPIDGDVLLAVDVDHLRALLTAPDPTAGEQEAWLRGYNAGHDELKAAVEVELHGPGLSPTVDARIRSALADGDTVEARTVPASPPAVAASTGTSEDVEALAKVLAGHQRKLNPGGSCLCGEWPTSAFGPTWVDHLASVVLTSDWLAAREAAARAEALRGAAVSLRGSALHEFDARGPHDARGAAIWDAAEWLQERADEVRP